MVCVEPCPHIVDPDVWVATVSTAIAIDNSPFHLSSKGMQLKLILCDVTSGVLFNRPFSTDVTSCSLINQHCWIARILDDISSLITIACYLGSGVVSQRILSISHRECTRGGKSYPPLVHSLWEMDGIQWCITPEPSLTSYCDQT